MEVDDRMLGELVAMGFSKTLAAKALSSSGNSSIEDAINWLVNHEDDAATSETSMEPEVLENINIEASRPIQISEQVKLRAQELRDQVRKRRAEQEKKLDREREKERIRAGKELLEALLSFSLTESRFLAQRKEKRIKRKREEHGKYFLVNTELPQKSNNPHPVDPAALPQTLDWCSFMLCLEKGLD